MGLTSFFHDSKTQGVERIPESTRNKIVENIEVCDEVCVECPESLDEEVLKDEKVFSKMKVDRETTLFESSKVSGIHFVVPTSQADWQRDACAEKPGSIQYLVEKWIGRHKDVALGPNTTLRCSVSSLPMDILDIAVMKGEKNNILVLPHFIKLIGVTAATVEAILDEIFPLLLKYDLERLLTFENIQACPEDSFVFLCSHTTRDKRCGLTAPILQKHFFMHLQEHGLYRDVSDFRPKGCNVAFINHVGGHKFAANVIIYLKNPHTLIWLGRVSPLHVESIVRNILLPDIPKLPFPENVRCVQRYDF
ncbi:Apd1p Ecym_5340 [Eremothecium cymbalariae DBVPG|uniref:Actin patches distal protein 1 n=1 Tax=Eremothecium cymbalariae (strain CBS 270.75 / DBVPG 7215 / KCTC 17166 / NRRL Y-17582) TaxID=931890 RepID=I6NDF7_ERECY|nr:hypothetical protein Ecym_5340 [Eremothecium cymbalariae DBVPG\